jgi:hypothetical protein
MILNSSLGLSFAGGWHKSPKQIMSCYFKNSLNLPTPHFSAFSQSPWVKGDPCKGVLQQVKVTEVQYWGQSELAPTMAP